MMMPANFTAVAENEMTYVVGGADLAKYLAPAMTAANWATVSTNLINLVGNTYINKYLGQGLKMVFQGDYIPGGVTAATFHALGNVWDNNIKAGSNNGEGDGKGWGVARAMTNVGLQIVGGLSAIYTLGDSKIGLKLEKTSF